MRGFFLSAKPFKQVPWFGSVRGWLGNAEQNESMHAVIEFESGTNTDVAFLETLKR